MDDIRGSTTLYDDREDLALIIHEIKKHILNYNEVKVALIADNPQETVLNILFETLAREYDNYFVAVFSTVEAAKTWLRS